MNPQHREFFVKLLRLCREFDAKINADNHVGVEISFRNGLYSFHQFDQYFQGVTERIRRRIEEYEEPQP